MNAKHTDGLKILLAASAVSMVLGSIHAFSIFLVPLEAKFEASRATISLVYSFGLVFLTIAVLIGPSFYSKLKPATVYMWVAFLGTLGACIAGAADQLALVFIGYSLVFGLANGLGYGFGLQFAARANPDRAGFAMGVVTAAYALGAVLAPYGFELALGLGGFQWAMLSLGFVVLIMSLGAGILVARTGATYAQDSGDGPKGAMPFAPIAKLWLAYGAGVAAGLMAIGHAAGIAGIAGFSGWVAAAVIAACNLVGSLLSGWLADRASHRAILTCLPLVGGVALFGLTALPTFTIFFLGLVGFTYGGIIATYPAVIAKRFSGEDGPRAYGRVFTAWGFAGLMAPWLAGRIYDLGGSYTPALWAAAALALVSALTAAKILKA